MFITIEIIDIDYIHAHKISTQKNRFHKPHGRLKVS